MLGLVYEMLDMTGYRLVTISELCSPNGVHKSLTVTGVSEGKVPSKYMCRLIEDGEYPRLR